MNTILKISLILFCSFLCMLNMEAQTFTSEFKVGLTMAEMDMKGANMYKTPKYGFSLNVLVGYKLKSGMQFQTGFIMTKRGSRQHEDQFVKGNNDDYTYRDITSVVDANYMLIPLTIGYESNTNKSLAFNVNVGAYGGRGFKGDTKVTGIIRNYEGSAIISESAVYNKQDTFSSTLLKRLDYGLLANASVIFSSVIVTAGYEYGLMNVSNSAQEMKNRNLSVALGLRF